MAWSSSEQKEAITPPSRPGSIDRQVVKRTAGGWAAEYYQWSASENKWNEITKEEYDTEVVNAASASSLGSIPGGNGQQALGDTTALRYPSGQDIGAQSHYVMFEFYDYNPPFGGRSPTEAADANNPQSQGKAGPPAPSIAGGAVKGYDYNQTGQYDLAGDKYKTILMYMPEDISTGFKANWGGKAVSNIGANTLRAAGAEGFKKIAGAGKVIDDATQNLLALTGSAALRKSIQSITGDSLSNNDVFGGISGAILNPNTELLFDSIDMRNFTLNFKLVPRYDTEAEVINKICKTFKAAMLPTKDPGKVFSMRNQGIVSSFIGVPKLCRVYFMAGPNENVNLPRFKMCAITEVNVSNTPDGVYATYYDGRPVATSLSISFQETKLVYAEEILDNNIR